jgi:two-component system alkaline phosphatase synthesis response regulator PhoP
MGDAKIFRVLVVDDDPDILDLLKYNLGKEGYKVKVVGDSAKAIRAARSFSPDLIVLDIMMPHPNGIELCRELRKIRKFEKTYIFFLTARSEPYYQQAALDTGADDYIEKLTGLRLLIHKINAVLENAYVIRKSFRELRVGDIVLDRTSTTIRIGESSISLNKPEFELIYFLAQNSGRSFSLDSLLKSLWGSEFFLSESSLESYIQNLRIKIGGEFIQRTKDFRYRFIA